MSVLTGKKRYISYTPLGVLSKPLIVLQVEESYYDGIPGEKVATDTRRWRDATLEDLTEFTSPIKVEVK